MFEDWTNCQVCEYNPTGDKCELFGRVIGMHGCSSGVERKPRNYFEMLKSMTEEQLVEFLFSFATANIVFFEHTRQQFPKEEILKILKEAVVDA